MNEKKEQHTKGCESLFLFKYIVLHKNYKCGCFILLFILFKTYYYLYYLFKKIKYVNTVTDATSQVLLSFFLFVFSAKRSVISIFIVIITGKLSHFYCIILYNNLLLYKNRKEKKH